MTFKPMALKTYQAKIKKLHWTLEKGSIDWNLYDEAGRFICSIKIIHPGMREVSATSVKKTEKEVQKRGLTW